LYREQDAAGLPRTGWHALRRSALLLPEVTALSPTDQRDFARHRNVDETFNAYQRQAPEATARRLVEALG
jgi:hypothetical protein